MKITVEKARDGHSVPIVEEEGRTYHLGSMYDGRMFAKIWCDHHLDPNATVDLVLMGMGDMQIITEAESRLRGDIFVYEPCREIFNQMKTTPLFKKAQKQYHIHITTDFHEFSVWLTGLLNDDILDASVFFVHPGCYRVFWNEDVEKIHTMLTRAIGKLADFRDALSVVLDQVVMNELRNICSLKGGILLSRLFGRWSQDIPVIIVGAGPSLKKNINELKRVGNRACILAMDTALPLLVKEGIRPHMLASVDAGKPLIIFGDMKTLDMPILVTSNTVPELIRETPGKKIWCYEAHAFARYIREMIEEDSPTVPTDYGVSSLAVSFPVEMGTKKIIFVGMDMAFSPEGDSHAGVIHNDFIRDDEYILDGYYGDKVYSRNDWVDMKNWIEEIVDVVTYCTYINATEGGIRIK
ncbi:MAG: motility associated factor glycosyltransferase family protein, partial [Eubacterium sp.]|nr:motility associated factor glycosyltransferase family protein [Eubacterium sp.]